MVQSALDNFDFRNPDYSAVFAERARRLAWIRADDTGDRLRLVSAHYATDEGQIDFIADWGMTFDPRLAEVGLPTVIPFIPFPKQREFLRWVLARWRNQEPGVADKSRDWGLTWLAIALSCSLCLFREGLHIGFGSRKEVYVDSAKEPKAMFHKARQFIELLPAEFRGGWNRKANSSHMLIEFPATGSVMTGEAGDNIGAGDRATLYWLDEAALIARPQLVEASLSQTTNCQIGISTPRGMTNPFAEKVHRADWIARGMVFHAHWRDDPRKDDAWYAKQQFELDAVTLAQEVDMSYTASVVGVVIPQIWVQAAVGAAEALGIGLRGGKAAAYDPGDEGNDENALCATRSIQVESVTTWTGKGSDIFESVARVFTLCDVLGITEFEYDADGLGAGVRGDARILNEQRKHKIKAHAWRGSGEVVAKDKPIPSAAGRNTKRDPGEIVRLNGDYFENAKAQGWFDLRARFQRTYRARQMAATGEDWRKAYSPDDLVSLNPKMPGLSRVTVQLSQPTYTAAKSGKMMIDKTPDGGKSPNEADSIMMRFAPRKRSKSYNLEAFST